MLSWWVDPLGLDKVGSPRRESNAAGRRWRGLFFSFRLDLYSSKGVAPYMEQILITPKNFGAVTPNHFESSE